MSKDAMRQAMPVTAEELRQLVSYDPATGVMKWKSDRWTGRHNNVRVACAGDEAGYIHKIGYRYVCINSVRYLGHRLAWLYVHGNWPTHGIDHINGDKSDNRIANLRDVSQALNVQNQRGPRADNRGGVMGCWKVRNRWKASVWVDGKSRYIGTFDTSEQAHAAYVAAKRIFHEGCTL